MKHHLQPLHQLLPLANMFVYYRYGEYLVLKHRDRGIETLFTYCVADVDDSEADYAFTFEGEAWVESPCYSPGDPEYDADGELLELREFLDDCLTKPYYMAHENPRHSKYIKVLDEKDNGKIW